MKFELATVLACEKMGCRVAPLKGNIHIEARYSSLVQDRIKIQPEHLVAIDTGANPPEIVWRWIRAAVIELAGDIFVVGDQQSHAGKVSIVPDLPLTIKIDDEVWTCGMGCDYEIHDIIVDGKPTHIAPIIEEIYRQ